MVQPAVDTWLFATVRLLLRRVLALEDKHFKVHDEKTQLFLDDLIPEFPRGIFEWNPYAPEFVPANLLDNRDDLPRSPPGVFFGSHADEAVQHCERLLHDLLDDGSATSTPTAKLVSPTPRPPRRVHFERVSDDRDLVQGPKQSSDKFNADTNAHDDKPDVVNDFEYLEFCHDLRNFQWKRYTFVQNRRGHGDVAFDELMHGLESYEETFWRLFNRTKLENREEEAAGIAEAEDVIDQFSAKLDLAVGMHQGFADWMQAHGADLFLQLEQQLYSDHC